MLFDHPTVSQRYFFPRRGRPTRDTFEVQVDGAILCCARHQANPSWPWIVHFHGNGEIVADYIPDLADTFAALGANSFFAEYRGYGGSTGAPLLATMLTDTHTIAEQVGAPAHKQIVMGRSVGSIYAIEYAAHQPTTGALVIESGIASVLQRIMLRAHPSELGATLDALQEEDAALFDHRAKLSKFENPTLLLHTRHDHIVGVEHAEHNFEWSAAADKHLEIFERGDHNSIFGVNHTAYLEHIAAMITKVA